MRLRIATILVGHERPAYLEAFRRIDERLAKLCPDAVRATVIVDNARARVEHERLSDELVVVGGDNSHREFSAWDLGLAELERRRENPDLVHFATSAFDALYADYLDLFSEAMLRFAVARRAVVGHVDYYDEPVQILGRTSQSWLRTSFFFAPTVVARALRSVVSFEAADHVFSGDAEDPFRSDAPLCETYRRYIRSWLTGAGTGQGVVWHSRFDLTEETRPLFEAKARAILNEHLLSVRLREAGVPVCDTTWLAGALGNGGAGEGIDETTDWRTQIEQRP